jgi:hypothetical protein
MFAVIKLTWMREFQNVHCRQSVLVPRTHNKSLRKSLTLDSRQKKPILSEFIGLHVYKYVYLFNM